MVRRRSVLYKTIIRVHFNEMNFPQFLCSIWQKVQQKKKKPLWPIYRYSCHYHTTDVEEEATAIPAAVLAQLQGKSKCLVVPKHHV